MLLTHLTYLQWVFSCSTLRSHLLLLHSYLITVLLPQKFQILNIPLFEHNLRPLTDHCSKPSTESALGMRWPQTSSPSSHYLLPSCLFCPACFMVYLYTNSLVNILNSLSGLCLQNPNCGWTQPPPLGLHHVVEHWWGEGGGEKEKKRKKQKQSHNCAEMVPFRIHYPRPQVDSQHCFSNLIYFLVFPFFTSTI